MVKKRKGIKNRMSHDVFLDDLVIHLNDIEENKKEIRWIMKDGIWMPRDTVEYNQLCDLILVYYQGYGIPVELKGSTRKRAKAIEQLESGRRFIEDVLNLECPYGKIVIYNHSRRALYDQRQKNRNMYKVQKIGYR